MIDWMKEQKKLREEDTSLYGHGVIGEAIGAEISGKRQGYEVPKDRGGMTLEENVECPLCKRKVAAIEAHWVGGTYIRYVVCELCPFWREL